MRVNVKLGRGQRNIRIFYYTETAYTHGYEQSRAQRERAAQQTHFRRLIDDFPQKEWNLTNTIHAFIMARARKILAEHLI